MANTPESGQTAVVDRLHVTPNTADTQLTPPHPLMAPELALLRDAQMPLNPLSLPSVRLEHGTVVMNITTPDSTNSPEWLAAIAHLQARGCTVKIDRESSMDFVHVQITAPTSLFPPEAITALETNRQVQETRAAAARAQAATEAMIREQEVGYGC